MSKIERLQRNYAAEQNFVTFAVYSVHQIDARTDSNKVSELQSIKVKRKKVATCLNIISKIKNFNL